MVYLNCNFKIEFIYILFIIIQMFMIKHDSKYMKNDLHFTDNIENAALLHLENIEYVNELILFRLKLGDKYITSLKSKICLNDIPSYESMFVLEYGYIYSFHGLLVKHLNKLSVENIDNVSDLSLYKLSHPVELNNSYLSELVKYGIFGFQGLTKIDKVKNYIKNNDISDNSDLLQMNNMIFSELLNDPILNNVLSNIFPKKYHCTSFSYHNTKDSADHNLKCSYPYTHLDYLFTDETLSVEILWALDNLEFENGGIDIVLGSYKLKKIPDGTHGDLFSVVMNQGDIVMYFGKSWHRDRVNKINKSSSLLKATFSPLYIPTFFKSLVSTSVDDKKHE